MLYQRCIHLIKIRLHFMKDVNISIQLYYILSKVLSVSDGLTQ